MHKSQAFAAHDAHHPVHNIDSHTEQLDVALAGGKKTKKKRTRVDHELGHSQTFTVREWINNVHEQLGAWVVNLSSEVQGNVVLKRERPTTVGTVVVMDVFDEVELIHHDRHHAHHARIDSGCGPGGPAALRGSGLHRRTAAQYHSQHCSIICCGAGGRGRGGGAHANKQTALQPVQKGRSGTDHVERRDVDATGLHELGDGVQRPDSPFGHGQAKRPFVHIGQVSAVEHKLEPGECNDSIFGARLLLWVGHERHVLVGHLEKRGTNGAGLHGDIRRHNNVFVGRLREPLRQVLDVVRVVAAGDPQEGIVVELDVGRDNDAEHVPPDRARRVLRSEPLLTGDVDEVSCGAKRREQRATSNACKDPQKLYLRSSTTCRTSNSFSKRDPHQST